MNDRNQQIGNISRCMPILPKPDTVDDIDMFITNFIFMSFILQMLNEQ